MTDKFFTQKYCNRCKKELVVRTMSMFNTDCICLDCKKKEESLDNYKEACKAERDAIQNGNYNFKGIGLNNH